MGVHKLCATALACALLTVPTFTVPAFAGPQNLITNGNFDSFNSVTNNAGTTAEQIGGFGQGGVSNLPGWSSPNMAHGNNSSSYGFNLLFTPGSQNSVTGSGSYDIGSNQLLWLAPGLSNPNGSDNFVALDADSSFATPLSTTVTGLTAGKGYYVSFLFGASGWYCGTHGNANGCANFQAAASNVDLKVSIANTIYDVFSSHPAGLSTNWVSESFWFRADGTSDTLQFLAFGGAAGVPPFALLADTSLVDAPEPFSIAVLVVGAACVGAARHRRARAIPQA